MDALKPTAGSISQLLAERAFKKLRQIFKEIEVADLSEILAQLDIVSCIVLYRLIPKDRRAEVFSYLPFELQAKLLDQLPDLVSASLLNQMETVDRTHLLQNLPFEIREKLILKLHPEEMQITWQMLSYKASSVGRLMNPEFFSIPSGMSVHDALAAIRWSGSRVPENLLNQIFVVDPQGKLLGHVNLSSLVLADPASILVDELMDRQLVTLLVTDDRRKAVDVFRKYDRPYIPVLNTEGGMIGLIEAEDVFDVAEEEATLDIQAFGGQSSLQEAYFQTSLWQLIRKRGSWLVAVFVLSMLSSVILKNMFSDRTGFGLMLLFLPMVLSAGGMAGSQAAAMTMRGLAVREILGSDFGRLLGREILIGLALGLMLGLIGFGFAHYAEGLDRPYAMVLAALVGVTVILGILLGALLPFIMRRFRWDPVIASAPVIATVVDILGLLLLMCLTLYWVQDLVKGSP
ncbi:MAG TPA: magnesium transporter [Oligoflexus sp.]|uniref:magnesium transporter n=1 Tax=Oligoflexus sp. TaxID=1971216 RepID=UPI002D808893|nr:magnesium transporter [Oligoflexus sp.]HET9237605.1 magnesium transporter [Oligoflexus sp.]